MAVRKIQHGDLASVLALMQRHAHLENYDDIFAVDEQALSRLGPIGHLRPVTSSSARTPKERLSGLRFILFSNSRSETGPSCISTT
jgi:hypothetical protein